MAIETNLIGTGVRGKARAVVCRAPHAAAATAAARPALLFDTPIRRARAIAHRYAHARGRRTGFRAAMARSGAWSAAPGDTPGAGDHDTTRAAALRLRAITAGTRALANVPDALAIRQVIHAIDTTAREGRRVSL
ncbi:MAG: hypothetical protein HUJ24_11855 [Rhodobacteraceae bacterium]|nr:hypothetical protein [Paracoccaceae bacterium]